MEIEKTSNVWFEKLGVLYQINDPKFIFLKRELMALIKKKHIMDTEFTKNIEESELYQNMLNQINICNNALFLPLVINTSNCFLDNFFCHVDQEKLFELNYSYESSRNECHIYVEINNLISESLSTARNLTKHGNTGSIELFLSIYDSKKQDYISQTFYMVWKNQEQLTPRNYPSLKNNQHQHIKHLTGNAQQFNSERTDEMMLRFMNNCLYNTEKMMDHTHNSVNSIESYNQKTPYCENNQAIFTNVGLKDVPNSHKFYLICRAVHIGTMDINTSPMKDIEKLTHNIRRPYAIAALDITEYLRGDCNADPSIQHFIPFSLCVEHESTTQAIKKIIQNPEITNNNGLGIWVSLKRFDKLNDEDTKFSRNSVKIGRMDSTEIIQPNEFRNDLYITLVAAELFRNVLSLSDSSHKSSAKTILQIEERSIQVDVTLHDKTGKLIENMICKGISNEPNALVTTFKSCVVYHDDKPKWDESFKLSLPVELFHECHLRFTFVLRHSFYAKDKCETPFALSYLPLIGPNTYTALTNGHHHLLVYRIIDAKKWIGSQYCQDFLNLPYTKLEIQDCDVSDSFSPKSNNTGIKHVNIKKSPSKDFLMKSFGVSNSVKMVDRPKKKSINNLSWKKSAVKPKQKIDPSSFAMNIEKTTEELEKQFGLAASLKDSFIVKSALFSTKLTQNEILLRLLSWNECRDPIILQDILKNVPKIEANEIVKYLPDIMDALFAILVVKRPICDEYKPNDDDIDMDNSLSATIYDCIENVEQQKDNEQIYAAKPQYNELDEMDFLVFEALVSVLGVVTDRKYSHYKNVIDNYLMGSFSSTLIHRKILKLLCTYIHLGHVFYNKFPKPLNTLQRSVSQYETINIQHMSLESLKSNNNNISFINDSLHKYYKCSLTLSHEILLKILKVSEFLVLFSIKSIDHYALLDPNGKKFDLQDYENDITCLLKLATDFMLIGYDNENHSLNHFSSDFSTENKISLPTVFDLETNSGTNLSFSNDSGREEQNSVTSSNANFSNVDFSVHTNSNAANNETIKTCHAKASLIQAGILKYLVPASIHFNQLVSKPSHLFTLIIDILCNLPFSAFKTQRIECLIGILKSLRHIMDIDIFLVLWDRQLLPFITYILNNSYCTIKGTPIFNEDTFFKNGDTFIVLLTNMFELLTVYETINANIIKMALCYPSKHFSGTIDPFWFFLFDHITLLVCIPYLENKIHNFKLYQSYNTIIFVIFETINYEMFEEGLQCITQQINNRDDDNLYGVQLVTVFDVQYQILSFFLSHYCFPMLSELVNEDLPKISKPYFYPPTWLALRLHVHEIVSKVLKYIRRTSQLYQTPITQYLVCSYDDDSTHSPDSVWKFSNMIALYEKYCFRLNTLFMHTQLICLQDMVDTHSKFYTDWISLYSNPFDTTQTKLGLIEEIMTFWKSIPHTLKIFYILDERLMQHLLSFIISCDLKDTRMQMLALLRDIVSDLDQKRYSGLYTSRLFHILNTVQNTECVDFPASSSHDITNNLFVRQSLHRISNIDTSFRDTILHNLIIIFNNTNLSLDNLQTFSVDFSSFFASFAMETETSTFLNTFSKHCLDLIQLLHDFRCVNSSKFNLIPESRRLIKESLLDSNILPASMQQIDFQTFIVWNLAEYFRLIGDWDIYQQYLDLLSHIHYTNKDWGEIGYVYKRKADLLEWNLKDECDKIKHYKCAIEYFARAKLWEPAIAICNEIIAFYTNSTTFNYGQICRWHELISVLYNCVMTQVRPEIEYYRVAFIGIEFPTKYRNKEFVYRGNAFERIAEFIQRMKEMHPDAQIINLPDIQSIPKFDDVDDEKGYSEHSNKKIIQINKISPINEHCKEFDTIILVSDQISSYYKYNGIKDFEYTRPLPPKKINNSQSNHGNEFADIWVEKTIIHAQFPLPSMLKLVPILDTFVINISPLQNAIETMEETNRKLKSAIKQHLLPTYQSNNSLLTLSNESIEKQLSSLLHSDHTKNLDRINHNINNNVNKCSPGTNPRENQSFNRNSVPRRTTSGILSDNFANSSVNTLSLLLNGIVDPAVMGGISNYEKAFLNNKYLEENPEDTTLVYNLKQLIVSQIPLLEMGLVIHGVKCHESLQEFHVRMEQCLIKHKQHIFENYGNVESISDPATNTLRYLFFKTYASTSYYESAVSLKTLAQKRFSDCVTHNSDGSSNIFTKNLTDELDELSIAPTINPKLADRISLFINPKLNEKGDGQRFKKESRKQYGLSHLADNNNTNNFLPSNIIQSPPYFSPNHAEINDFNTSTLSFKSLRHKGRKMLNNFANSFMDPNDVLANKQPSNELHQSYNTNLKTSYTNQINKEHHINSTVISEKSHSVWHSVVVESETNNNFKLKATPQEKLVVNRNVQSSPTCTFAQNVSEELKNNKIRNSLPNNITNDEHSPSFETQNSHPPPIMEKSKAATNFHPIFNEPLPQVLTTNTPNGANKNYTDEAFENNFISPLLSPHNKINGQDNIGPINSENNLLINSLINVNKNNQDERNDTMKNESSITFADLRKRFES